MDPAARERRWLFAVGILVVVGLASGTLLLVSGCPETGCESPRPLFVVSSVSWIVAAIVALAVVGLGLARRSGPPGDAAPRQRVAAPGAAPSAAGAATPRLPDSLAPEARVRAVLEAIERLPTDEVRLLAVVPHDSESHAFARRDAETAASARGRAQLVRDARAAIADWVGHAFGTRSYDPTFAGLAWRLETLRPEDRRRLAETLGDAVLAVIAQDLVEEAAYDELVGPCAGVIDGARADAGGGTPVLRA